jgi:hypothetical protein
MTKKQQRRINSVAASTRRKAKYKAAEDMRTKCIQVVRDAMTDGTIGFSVYEFISGNIRNIE